MIILITLYIVVISFDLLTPSGFGAVLYTIPVLYSTQLNGRKTIAICSVVSIIMISFIQLIPVVSSGGSIINYDMGIIRIIGILNMSIKWFLLDRLKIQMTDKEALAKKLESTLTSLQTRNNLIADDLMETKAQLYQLEKDATLNSDMIELLQKSEERLARYVSSKG